MDARPRKSRSPHQSAASAFRPLKAEMWKDVNTSDYFNHERTCGDEEPIFRSVEIQTECIATGFVATTANARAKRLMSCPPGRNAQKQKRRKHCARFLGFFLV